MPAEHKVCETSWPYEGHVMDSKGHLSDPFQDVFGEEMLSSC